MATTIGRVTLTTPMGVPFNVADPDSPSIGGPSYVDAYGLHGRETGSGAQATMDLLLRELKRMGALYCTDADTLFPAGYYRLKGNGSGEKPSGSPRTRPWDVQLLSTPRPRLVTRQAEDDNVAGVDTADTSGDADEDSKVDYTTTNAYAAVLQPRTAAGAEAVNLPQGTWRVVLRAYALTTATAQARWILESSGGSVLATGADITLGTAGGWKDYDLGTLAVPAANHKANWYRVEVKDVTNPASHVYLDRIRLGIV